MFGVTSLWLFVGQKWKVWEAQSKLGRATVLIKRTAATDQRHQNEGFVTNQSNGTSLNKDKFLLEVLVGLALFC